MATFIISPHFDDAILSAWSIANNDNVFILTICGGVPEKHTKIASSDKNCGFNSAADAAICRKAEDLALCKHIKSKYIHLNEFDYPYAPNKNIWNIENEISKYITSNDIVYAPLGIGKHPDHILSRNIIINMFKKIKFLLIFYADYPYASEVQNSQVGSNWGDIINEIIDQKIILHMDKKITLRDSELNKKIKCVCYYKSQIEMLKRNYPKLLDVPGILNTEYYWRCIL